MKQSILLFLLIGSATLYAQSPKFHDAMSQAITELEKDTTVEQLMAVSNRFERIALAEKDQWLPYYYAAYARSIAGFITTDKSKVDEVLDGAQKFADIADSLSPGNSEVVLLKGMVLAGRISVDPMSRGQQFGMQSGMLMNQAMQLNPENPRAYLMIGQGLFYTPEQFGGGKDKGCAMLEQSRMKFETFEPESDIHPNWGENLLGQMMAPCGSGSSVPHQE